MKVDVAVVGAGVVGLFTAYTLAERLGYSVAVLEREKAPGLGVTARSANVIHVLQPPFNSLKSRLCLRGNALYRRLAGELGFRVIETRAILATTKRSMKPVAWVAARLLRRILPPEHRVMYASGREVRDIEPEASDSVEAGVVVEGYGVVDHRELVGALARRVRRSAELLLGAEVKSIDASREGAVLHTAADKVEARAVVNAAGLYADEVARLAGDPFYEVKPLKGVMSIHDGPKLRAILAPLELSRKETKGGGAIPQTDGSLLLGPNNAGYASSKVDEAYSQADLGWLRRRFQPLLSSGIPEPKRVIVGLRPTVEKRDFIIEWSRRGAPVIHLVGIESPGLTAAPAIAEVVAEMLRQRLPPSR
ncbi:MAG: FAD-dependent oxidoreductase [Thermoproteota archaeon]